MAQPQSQSQAQAASPPPPPPPPPPPQAPQVLQPVQPPVYITYAVDLSLAPFIAWSDGTGQRGAGWTPIANLDDYMRSLNLEWERLNPTARVGYTAHFHGGLPNGFTLMTRSGVMVVFGHPTGKRFRSARSFLPHIVEMLVGLQTGIAVPCTCRFP